MISNNRLIIAAAGAGKTTFIVKESLNSKNSNILITTYTQTNEQEIRKKFIELNKCIPPHVTIQTWFSFLLQHGVRPYQNVLLPKKRINNMLLVNEKSGIRYTDKNGKKIQYKEDTELEQHYVITDSYKIYSDKLSKFVIRCNEKTRNAVIDRISRIYTHIFIDEVQDLAGYDLDLLKLFFKTSSNIILVGDPRQTTYLTHNESRYKKYRWGRIQEFLAKECKNTQCCIDDETLKLSYRNNLIISNFASKLYPEFIATESLQKEITDHDGVFYIKTKDVPEYLSYYKPIQLRFNKSVGLINDTYKAVNFGESKGMTFDRVLIYPTQAFSEWLNNSNHELKPIIRAKFYVAITRAKYSVGIIFDPIEQNQDLFSDEKNSIDTIPYWKPSNQ
ncbi:MAG: UvrD-helicase domain-containing protein [Burkholderiales bacterium]|nr:UvrD-helicase domain-containing protein [Burkholderiales bacterium]